jgi:hypothetical protein
MNSDETLDRLMSVLGSNGYRFSCEDELQQAIASVLTDCSIHFDREHQMEMDRLDFRVGNVAVEIKVAGSVTEVIRQLHRYSQSQEIEALLLVTSKSRHRTIPREMNGKRVEVLYLNPLSSL